MRVSRGWPVKRLSTGYPRHLVCGRAEEPLRWCSSSSFSLGDLAKAFNELGGTTTATFHSSSSSPTPVRADRSTNRPSRSESGNDRSRPSSLTGTPSTAATKTSSLLAVEPSYILFLAELDEVGIYHELELHRKKLHFGKMLSALIHVWYRLRLMECSLATGEGAHRETRVPTWCSISEDEATGGSNSSTSTRRTAPLDRQRYFRSDRILESLMKIISKVDVADLEGEMEVMIRHQLLHYSSCQELYPDATMGNVQPSPLLRYMHLITEAPTVDSMNDIPRAANLHFSSDLSILLQRWMMARVACFDADTSLRLIHAISQQRIFFSDALLETLVDNVSYRCHEVVELNHLAILLDAMLRMQGEVLKALNRFTRTKHAQTPSPDNTQQTGDGAAAILSSPSTLDAPRSHRSRMMDRLQRHPLTNEPFYTLVVERLRSLLEKHAGRSATTLAISTTSFFFLTRALGKLVYLHPHIISSMLPLLPAYLAAHPENFLGVVQLLGREDNTTNSREACAAIMDALTCLLQRRGAVFRAAAPQNRSHDDSTLTSTRSMEEDGELSLLSADGDDDVAPTHAEDAKSATTRPTSFRMSLVVDLHSYPLFLDCMSRQLRLGVEAADGPHATALLSQASGLVDLLLADLHSGLPPLRRMIQTVSASFMERLLLTTVGIYSLTHPSTSAASSTAVLPPPLLVELTYAWTRHVETRPIHSKSSSSAISAIWWKQARRLHAMLLEAGLLEVFHLPPRRGDEGGTSSSSGRPRLRYVMPMRIISSVESVKTAVEEEQLRLGQRLMEQRARTSSYRSQQQQQRQRDSSHRYRARPSAVFANFSNVIAVAISE